MRIQSRIRLNPVMKYYLLAFLILGWSPGLKLSQSARFPNFQLSKGDHVTCLPIREQPSLRSLLDSTSSYQEPIVKPSFELKLKEKSRSSGHGDLPETKLAGQVFNTEGGSCPEGTIPVRQSRGNVTRKVGDSKRFSRLVHSTQTSPGTSTNSSISDPQVDDIGLEHEYSTAYDKGTDRPGGFGGAGASFNVWQPYVEKPHEFSISQLWILAGSYINNDLNTIEVGWQVCERKYGDKLPHLFIYWTSDAYKTTGCYNLDCPGFIQTNSNYVIGGAWSPISVTDGIQYDFKALVFLDSIQSAWWLQLNDEYVGYWPTSIFSRLKTGADNIDWGGEITNDAIDGRHTQTVMGSGAFASDGFGKAAHIKLMQTVDLANTLHDAPNDRWDGPGITKAGCYTAEKGPPNTNWGTHIFFGGPGYSASCPT